MKVDTAVGRFLFEKCLCTHLKGKTRVLVTHQLQFIKACDSVMVMENGACTEFDSLDNLLARENLTGFVSAIKDMMNNDDSEDVDLDDLIVDNTPISPSSNKKVEIPIGRKETVYLPSGPAVMADRKPLKGAVTMQVGDTKGQLTKETSAKGSIGMQTYVEFFRSGSTVLMGTILICLLVLGILILHK
jgi:ATP-binding cassette, subfamily C (CFTR/MRP), member 4